MIAQIVVNFGRSLSGFALVELSSDVLDVADLFHDVLLVAFDIGNLGAEFREPRKTYCATRLTRKGQAGVCCGVAATLPLATVF